ncbi:MAG: hypothetical protein ACLSCA_25195, partial [[Clostridium] symbiosum]
GSPPVLSEVPHELSIPLRAPKSANGPCSNSFRPDSPLHDQPPAGMEDSASPLTTPDMVRSGEKKRKHLAVHTMAERLLGESALLFCFTKLLHFDKMVSVKVRIKDFYPYGF